MKSRDLIEALLAVLGVYEVIQGIGLTAFYISFGAGSLADELPPLPTAIGAAIPIVLGSFLLAVREKLADRLSSVSESAAIATSENLLETLLAVAGVCFVVSALATGAAVAMRDYLRAGLVSELSGQAPRLDEEWAPRMRVLVELALGIWLSVGNRGIAAALAALRSGGRGRTAA